MSAALRALVAAAEAVDHAADADIYTDAPECQDTVNRLHDAIGELQAAIKVAKQEPEGFTYDHIDAAVCMWEHVLEKIGRVQDGKEKENPWNDYRRAHGMAATREVIMGHARECDAAYQEAVKNGYDDCFDWEFVPQWMEGHIVRILT